MTRADACRIAREESTHGYVQHVNRSDLGGMAGPIVYYVSDWYDDDSTCDSFEDGQRIGGIERFVDDA